MGFIFTWSSHCTKLLPQIWNHMGSKSINIMKSLRKKNTTTNLCTWFYQSLNLAFHHSSTLQTNSQSYCISKSLGCFLLILSKEYKFNPFKEYKSRSLKSAVITFLQTSLKSKCFWRGRCLLLYDSCTALGFAVFQ